MVCAACQRENPPNVQFCVGCGMRFAPVPAAFVSPPIVPIAPPAPQPVVAHRDGSLTAIPSVRPFVVVFAAVITFLSGLGWLLGSGFLMMLAATETAAGSNPYSGGVLGLAHESSGEALLSPAFVNTVFPLLNVAGFLAITGAIGLWTLTQWGRRLTVGVQVFGAILGVVILSEAGSKISQAVGLSGFFVLLGLIVMSYSGTIIVFLLRGDADVWFHTH